MRGLAGVLTCDPGPDSRDPGSLVVEAEAVLGRGLGVALLSSDGRRDLRLRVGTPMGLPGVCLGSDEASDIGGDGGSVSSEAASVEATDLASGGVVMSGELAVEPGEASMCLSKVGEPRADMSVEIMERWCWRCSCFLILSCMSSASILRSDSSSRSRWDSIRRVSRSCSPILISPSMLTLRSMAWLYLDSISSRDDVVLRA